MCKLMLLKALTVAAALGASGCTTIHGHWTNYRFDSDRADALAGRLALPEDLEGLPQIPVEIRIKSDLMKTEDVDEAQFEDLCRLEVENLLVNRKGPYRNPGAAEVAAFVLEIELKDILGVSQKGYQESATLTKQDDYSCTVGARGELRRLRVSVNAKLWGTDPSAIAIGQAEAEYWGSVPGPIVLITDLFSKDDVVDTQGTEWKSLVNVRDIIAVASLRAINRLSDEARTIAAITDAVSYRERPLDRRPR